MSTLCHFRRLRGRGRPKHKGTALANVWFLGEERFERSGLLGSIIVRHGRRSWPLFAPAPTRLRDCPCWKRPRQRAGRRAPTADILSDSLCSSPKSRFESMDSNTPHCRYKSMDLHTDWGVKSMDLHTQLGSGIHGFKHSFITVANPGISTHPHYRDKSMDLSAGTPFLHQPACRRILRSVQAAAGRCHSCA